LGCSLQFGVRWVPATESLQSCQARARRKDSRYSDQIEYKEDNGEFLKNKVRLCARGDQQIPGVSFQESDLYAPVLKAAEARLLLALAAANGAKVIKTDTKQAYLNGDMGDDVVYIRPPDWWPEPVLEGHVFLLLNIGSSEPKQTSIRLFIDE
jgi:hypothetical protein